MIRLGKCITQTCIFGCCHGLYDVPRKIHVYPEPQSVTLFGNGVFADVISSGICNETIPDLGWALNVLTGVFITEGKGNLNPEKQAMRGQRQNLQ